MLTLSWTPKARRFWPLFSLVLLTDCATKRAAEIHLLPAQVPHEFFGEIVRLTLAYNPGAAMSLSLGAHSRVGFSLLAAAALLIMAHLYRRTAPGDRQAAAGLALIAAGALGNLLDRLRSARGGGLHRHRSRGLAILDLQRRGRRHSARCRRADRGAAAHGACRAPVQQVVSSPAATTSKALPGTGWARS